MDDLNSASTISLNINVNQNYDVSQSKINKLNKFGFNLFILALFFYGSKMRSGKKWISNL